MATLMRKLNINYPEMLQTPTLAFIPRMKCPPTQPCTHCPQDRSTAHTVGAWEWPRDPSADEWVNRGTHRLRTQLGSEGEAATNASNSRMGLKRTRRKWRGFTGPHCGSPHREGARLAGSQGVSAHVTAHVAAHQQRAGVLVCKSKNNLKSFHCKKCTAKPQAKSNLKYK